MKDPIQDAIDRAVRLTTKVREVTAERNAAIAHAVELGASSRAVGDAVGLSHVHIQRLAKSERQRRMGIEDAQRGLSAEEAAIVRGAGQQIACVLKAEEDVAGQ